MVLRFAPAACAEGAVFNISQTPINPQTSSRSASVISTRSIAAIIRSTRHDDFACADRIGVPEVTCRYSFAVGLLLR